MENKTKIGINLIEYDCDACKEFINNLPDSEVINWIMINIRVFPRESGPRLSLQDVRGNVTFNHVFMVNCNKMEFYLLNIEENDRDLKHFLFRFKVYDPLYNIRNQNIGHYLCFFYTKINFDEQDTVNIGDVVDIEIQQKYNYSSNCKDWVSNSFSCKWQTAKIRFNPTDLEKKTEIDILNKTKIEIENFRIACKKITKRRKSAIIIQASFKRYVVRKKTSS